MNTPIEAIYERFAKRIAAMGDPAREYVELLAQADFSRRSPELGEPIDMMCHHGDVEKAKRARARLDPAHAAEIDAFLKSQAEAIK